MFNFLRSLKERIETFLVRADGQYEQGLERFIAQHAGADIADLDYWIRVYDRNLADRRCWVE